MLEIGEKALEFEISLDDGNSVQLSKLQGGPVVLYFYPKDDTSGCTAEALDFSASLKSFKKQGATVIGISPDGIGKHQKFKAKHNLTVSLGSDESREIVNQYGVWVQKSMYGRKYMGVERTTFLIDADGRIAKIWRKVRVPGHVDEVLQVVQDLAP